MLCAALPANIFPYTKPLRILLPSDIFGWAFATLRESASRGLSVGDRLSASVCHRF